MARSGRGMPIRPLVPTLPRYQINDYAAVIDLDNPISHWRLGESSGSVAVDRKGVQNGTYNGGITKSIPSLLPGVSDTAVQLDGIAGSYVGVPYNASLAPVAFSIEVWAVLGVVSRTIISRVAVNPVWELAITTSRLVLWVYDTNGVRTEVQSPPNYATAVLNKQLHIVATYDHTQGVSKLFVNAEDIGTPDRTPNAAPRTQTNGIIIGAYQASIDGIQGILDEPALYGVALTPEQVTAHYQSGMGYPATFVGSPPTANIVSTTRTKISRVSGFDSTDVVWSSDGAFTEYQFRVVPNASDPVTQGVQIESYTFVPNLVANSGFETNTLGWSATTTAFTSTSISRSTSWASTGSASLRLAGTNGGSNGVESQLRAQSSDIAVVAGSTYSIGAVANVIDAGSHGLQIRARWYDAPNGSEVSSFIFSPVILGTGVMRPSLEGIVAPVGAGAIRFQIMALSQVNGDTVEIYIDDVVFVAAAIAPPHNMTGAEGSAGTEYTSTITDDEVDAVSPAEGAKVVKLFVKNTSGWSS